MSSEPPKKRRGRRKKSGINQEQQAEPKVPRRRDRKPKGGKLSSKQTNNVDEPIAPENVILHLKCNISDIDKNKNTTELSYDPKMPPEIKTYNILDNNVYCEYENANDDNNNNNQPETAFEAYNENKSINYLCRKCKKNINDDDELKANNLENDEVDVKQLHIKIKQQKQALYNNEMQGKTSACFWCTCDFDNNPCYIPKTEDETKLQGYGSFCRPECAVAYLFQENLDDSIKFERYSLLNKIYSKVYDYKNNIKPAPDPHYLLDKFYGNLNIQEYRKLLSSDNLLFVVDKPMTRVFPELFEDTDNFVVGIYDNSTSKTKRTRSNASVYKVKRESEKRPKPSKSSILMNKFGAGSTT